jgi:hypothetical protein
VVETGSADVVSDAAVTAVGVGATGLVAAGAETVALTDTVAGLSDGPGGSFGAGAVGGAGGSRGAIATGSDCAGAAPAFEPAAGETEISGVCVAGWVVLPSLREADAVGSGVVADLGCSSARERVGTETEDAGVPVRPTRGPCA